MTVISKTFGLAGQDGVTPRRVQMVVTDSLAAVTTANYLVPDQILPDVVYPTDIFDVIYSYNTNTGSGTYAEMLPVFAGNVITLNSTMTFAASTSSATPGTIRALVGKMTETATVMTSGNLVGVRGEVDYVGASGGFLYGVQGKLIPTGTLSGSSWNAGVFGQLDISHATINAGQTAPIWGDYGTTSGTITSASGMYGIAMTNTTAAVLESQIYLYGGATNLLLLNDNTGLVGSSYITSGGSGAPSGTVKKLAISIDGATYYIVASTVVS